MAFIGDNFVRGSSQANGAAMHTYTTTDDNLAAVKGANYFDVASATSGGYGLKNGDFIRVSATDNASFLQMAVDGTGAATVTSANDFT